MNVYKSKSRIEFVSTPSISGGILNIHGFAEYYIESLEKWIEKGSDWLCIDAGNDLYVKTEDIEKILKHNEKEKTSRNRLIL